MDAPSAETVKAYAELANSLSQFRTSMFLSLCGTVIVLGLGSTVMFLWFRRAMRKDRLDAQARESKREQQLETSKQARATLFTEAQLEQAKSLATLAATIQATHEASTQMNQTTNRTLGDLGSTVNRTGQALMSVASMVKRMTDKVEGRLSRDDSKKFIAAKLNADMYRAICGIIEKSFIENHFAGREAFISDRVRSRIRDVMVATRAELKELPLAMTVDSYFPTTTDDLGERFALCDQIWNKVSHLFEDRRPAEDRMDEASLLIENIIKDHIARTMRRDHSEVMGASEGEGESPSAIMKALDPHRAPRAT